MITSTNELSKIILDRKSVSQGVTLSYLTRSICLKYRAVAIFLLFLQPVFGQTKKSNDFGQSKFPDLDNEFAAKVASTSKEKVLSKDVILMLTNKDTTIYKKELGQFNSKTQAPLGRT